LIRADWDEDAKRKYFPNEGLASRIAAALADAHKAGMREAAEIAKDYRLRCEQTGCDLADKEDESSQRMYWRADGASDALEIIEGQIKDAAIRRRAEGAGEGEK
jgi:hypothetical protein